jgi:biotin synthase-like enzyme
MDQDGGNRMKRNRSPAKGLVAQAWEMYRDTVIPPDAHVTQFIECKRAFYAGARSLLTDIMIMADPGADPTDEDMDMMEDLELELQQFAADVAAGKE